MVTEEVRDLGIERLLTSTSRTLILGWTMSMSMSVIPCAMNSMNQTFVLCRLSLLTSKQTTFRALSKS
ncbi:hypothetical protein HanIR_Chr09g0439191 [Helianthus annuus]|nr:hypothetical protein HanIR_Chr09g0439191 [Helianthus annuus]